MLGLLSCEPPGTGPFQDFTSVPPMATKTPGSDNSECVGTRPEGQNLERLGTTTQEAEAACDSRWEGSGQRAAWGSEDACVTAVPGL